MADWGLFVGFGIPVRGRERRAIEVFNEALGYWTQLQQQGAIEGFEAVMLEPHGGDLGGFFLLRGDRERIARIRASDEFHRLSNRAALVVENFGVVGAALTGAIGDRMARYQEQVGDLI